MMEVAGLGLLTPEETLNRATRLNNSFQLLWRNATAAQKKELDPVMAGWIPYFNRLRDSWVARTTEYGELNKWEKIYQQLWDKFKAQGTKITAPVIVPGTTPGDVQVQLPSKKEMEDTEKRIQRVGAGLIAAGAVATLGVGWLLWRMRRRG